MSNAENLALSHLVADNSISDQNVIAGRSARLVGSGPVLAFTTPFDAVVKDEVPLAARATVERHAHVVGGGVLEGASGAVFVFCSDWHGSHGHGSHRDGGSAELGSNFAGTNVSLGSTSPRLFLAL